MYVFKIGGRVMKQKIYLSKEKVCHEMAMILVTENYTVRVSYDKVQGQSKKLWYVEFWR